MLPPSTAIPRLLLHLSVKAAAMAVRHKNERAAAEIRIIMKMLGR